MDTLVSFLQDSFRMPETLAKGPGHTIYLQQNSGWKKNKESSAYSVVIP